jgi:hypothetical protein
MNITVISVFLAEILEDIEDVHSERRVKHGRGLVGDEQFRLHHERRAIMTRCR